MGEEEVRGIVQAAIQEFLQAQQTKAEPAYQTELAEERKRRESLEGRVNELIAENTRSRAAAEEADRGAAVRAELQKLGVAKVDLAYRAVKDEIVRGADGQLAARDGAGLKEYLSRFAEENPELLPARLAGGSGATQGSRTQGTAAVDLDRIRPGMSADEMERVRQEVARVAIQTLRGLP